MGVENNKLHSDVTEGWISAIKITIRVISITDKNDNFIS